MPLRLPPPLMRAATLSTQSAMRLPPAERCRRKRLRFDMFMPAAPSLVYAFIRYAGSIERIFAAAARSNQMPRKMSRRYRPSPGGANVREDGAAMLFVPAGCATIFAIRMFNARSSSLHRRRPSAVVPDDGVRKMPCSSALHGGGRLPCPICAASRGGAAGAGNAFAMLWRFCAMRLPAMRSGAQ